MKSLRTCLVALGLASAGLAAHGQALPAASRAGDLQVGVGLSYGKTDIFDNAVTGISAYGTFDVGDHLGAEADVHMMLVNTPDDFVENTYLLGLRYKWDKTRYQPYVKALAGIGQTKVVGETFPKFVVNTPGTFFATGLGGGIDVHLTRKLNARGDFEYQIWPGFGPHALTPVVATLGVAYRFR